MGSKTFDGIRFSIYVADHPPPHTHGFLGDTSVIIDLLPDDQIRKSDRRDAVRPSNAKLSDVRRILEAAAVHAIELNELWEKIHGTAHD